MSLIMMGSTLMFALLKTQHLLSRQNPAVTSFISEDALSPEEKFELASDDFMIAFTLVDGVSKEPKLDQRYIKWQAAFYETANGKFDNWHAVDVYSCTQTDYAKFKEPDKKSKSRF